VPLLSAVLFDFGDTLFHSPDGAALMVGAGIPPAEAAALWERIWRSSKTAPELAKRRDVSAANHRAAWTGLFQPADAYVPGLAVRLYEEVMLPRNWLPYPDTAPTLAALRAAGVRVGVISNITAHLRPVFDAHGLAGTVDAYTHSYEHEREKPDPELFLEACRALGSLPGETLMVGDSHLADGGAVEAGMPVLLLPMVPPGTVRGLDLVLRAVGVAAAGTG